MMKTNKFFTMDTFATLGGCAIVAWLVTSVISGVIGTSAKYIGFFVSIGVAYIALFRTKGIRPVQYAIAFINGCLIYMTVVGGTSYMPAKPAVVIGTKRASVRSNLISPWNPSTKEIKEGSEIIGDLSKLNDSLSTTLGSVLVERDSCIQLLTNAHITIPQVKTRYQISDKHYKMKREINEKVEMYRFGAKKALPQ